MREKSIGVYHFCAYKYFRANPFKQNAQEFARNLTRFRGLRGKWVIFPYALSDVFYL